VKDKNFSAKIFIQGFLIFSESEDCMPIPPINSVNSVISTNTVNTSAKARKYSFLTPVSATGYGTLLLGGASAILARKKKIKPHIYLAYAAGALAVIHTALIEWHRFMAKKH